MNYPVVKGASYTLIHAPDMVIHQGTTQITERLKHADGDHLKKLPAHLRSFDEVVAYPPNQVYIGNLEPDALANTPKPWYENLVENAGRFGNFGEITPQDEFYGLMKAVDVFDLVLLEEDFQSRVKEKLSAHSVLGDIKELAKLDKNPASKEEIEKLVSGGIAEGMYQNGQLIGCVKRAHEFDVALSQDVLFENLVSKASAVIALKNLLAKTGLKPEEVDYLVECSEEACGDMNQRGGGNFAKAIGEICGCVNATGSDTRGFCAAPAHALVTASALAQAGIYQNVVVVAGGSCAKLGMNSRDHIKKEMPVMEDVLGTFAVHIGQNDGVNPIIRTDGIGRHKIGSGSSPQAVMQALVTDPIDKLGLSLSQIDRFSPEMQNPEITVPAGAGDVPNANYKMIAALGVRRGDFEKSELAGEVERFGITGYAPTQGHIPSGVPFVGFAREMILDGRLEKVMVIGKGSLFLGRLTNLFDGVSFLMEKNPGKQETGFDKDEVRKMIAEAMRGLAESFKEE
ncbi:MAG: glycine/sarcosine/betaine reductase complex component C subunit beta [Bacillota bacterium]